MRFKVEFSHLTKKFVLFASIKALSKRWIMFFISSEKLFWFLRYLRFRLDFFIIKRLDKKAKVNFKIYVINWNTKIYNKQIVICLKK